MELSDLIQNAFGPNVQWDDSVQDTADRVLRFWNEFNPPSEIPFKFTTFPTLVNQMIVVRNIEFSSLCAHHLLPWYGVANVGYLPNKLMVGLSKIPRLVEFWAKRPSTQEWVTAQIAHDLKKRLEAQGVGVVIQARHTCMACRGIAKHNAEMVTSEMRGTLLTSGEARMEFLNLITRRDI